MQVSYFTSSLTEVFTLVKAVIFDFDGTMIDTEALWFEQTKLLLKEQYDVDLPLEVFARIIGTTNEELIRYIMDKTNGLFQQESFQKILLERVEQQLTHLPLRSGFLPFFTQVKTFGCKIGLATSSSLAWIEPFLKRFDLYHDFDVICTSDDVEKVKPDPALYQKAIQTLEIEPHEAIAVEDSVNGSLAALRAGLHCVVVPNVVTKQMSFSDNVVLYDGYEKMNMHELQKRLLTMTS